MKSASPIAKPPDRPLLIYDGDCRFCRFWVKRWQAISGDRLDAWPFQDSRVPGRFPELPVENFAAAIHLILPDGSVYRGAEAALRARACNPRKQRLLRWYRGSTLFARIAEIAYRFVARHRTFFSRLTRLFWRVP